MPRKTKTGAILKSRKNITLSDSFTDWGSKKEPLSRKIQSLIASDVLGATLEQFKTDLYSDKKAKTLRNHPKDTMEQEFVRAARWSLESKITDILIKNDGTEILFQVHWLLTDTTVWVRTYPLVNGFKHVIYDEVVSEDIINALNVLPDIWVGVPDYEMYPERKGFTYFRLWCGDTSSGKVVNKVYNRLHLSRLFGIPVGLIDTVHSLLGAAEKLPKLYYVNRWLSISMETV